MSYFKEMTYKEIAEAMHISSRTVEEHVQKATKFLREDLKEVLFCLLVIVISMFQLNATRSKENAKKAFFFLFNPVVPSRLIVLIMKDNKESK